MYPFGTATCVSFYLTLFNFSFNPIPSSSLRHFEDEIGLRFHNPNLLRQAMTHSSLQEMYSGKEEGEDGWMVGCG